MRIDIHQHFWTGRLLAELSARRTAPYVRIDHGDWRLTIAGEADSLIEPESTDVDARLSALWAANIDATVIAFSSPAAIEDLPVAEASPLLEAHIAGVRELPAAFRYWAVSSVWRFDPDFVDAQLDAGAVGLQLPAGAVASPDGFDRAGPILDLLERRGAPLFIHPGAGPYSGLAIGAPVRSWWPALTRYVAEMNAAWHAFAAVGRGNHPNLRVVFAMLAGLAPLHHERLRSRGGPSAAGRDSLTFYDTSSYGERAIGAMAATVGEQQLVHGSDAPVIEPIGPPANVDAELLLEANPARLLGTGVIL